MSVKSVMPRRGDERDIRGSTDLGDFHIVYWESCEDVRLVASDGRLIGMANLAVKTPKDYAKLFHRLPASSIEGFDPKSELTGCCDPPDPSMRR